MATDPPDPYAVLDCLPDPVLHLDAGGRVVGVHGDCARALEHDVAVGESLADVASNGARSLMGALDGTGGRLEWVVMMPNGRFRVWEARLVEAPVAGHHLAMLRDVTARRRSEVVLAADKERLMVTLRSIREGVVSTDREGRVVWMNPAAERFLGIDAGTGRGRPIRELLGRPGTPRPEEGSHAVRLEVMLDDQVMHLTLGTHPVQQHGQLLGAVYTLRDVTDEDRAEAERMRASKLESVGLLAGGIAHDFNNLLASVTGNVAYLREVLGEEEDTVGVLDDLEVASRRAVGLTRQLLAFSTRSTPLTSAGSVARILEDAAETGVRGSAVRAEVVAAPDLHPVGVEADPMLQAIQNLVINACQAMPDGGTVRLEAENLLALPARLGGAVGPWVHVAVADEGEGIPEADLACIFDPYFTTRSQGSGLGLAMASAVVRRHGGHMTVDSYVGQGSTFDIYLPALPSAAEADDAPPASAALPRLEGRVLVVDDEAAVRQVAERLCRLMGLDVASVPDGAQALEAVRGARRDGRPFGVVLLDLTIPGGPGGIGTLPDLLELAPELPVVAMSGYSTGPVMREHRRYGFAAALAKPFDAHQLGAVLKAWLPTGEEGPAQSGTDR